MPRLRAPRAVLTLAAHATLGDWVNAVALSPDGRRVLAAAADGTVSAIEPGEGARPRILHRHEGPAVCLGVSARGALASGGHDGRVILDGAPLAAAPSWVDHLAWRPDGERLAVGRGRRVQMLRRDGEPLADGEPLPATVSCLDWHPRGEHLAAGSYGGVRLLRGEDLGLESHLDWTGSVLALRISPDGLRLAHGNQDASVHFWDLRDGSELEMLGYATKVRELDWRHDGRLLATGGGEEITVWDFAGSGPAGSRPLTLEGHGRPVAWLGFAPGSPTLASVGGDGVVIVWSPGTARRALVELELGEELSCAAWSADGRRLAIGGAEGSLVVLDVDHPGETSPG